MRMEVNRSATKATVAVFSNYAWAYVAAQTVKALCAGSEMTLFTVNGADVMKKHDFGMTVVRLPPLGVRHLPQLFAHLRAMKKKPFDSVIIDHGFNLTVALFVLVGHYTKLSIIDWGWPGVVRPITRNDFLTLFFAKIPYMCNKALIQLSKLLRLSVSLGMPSELSLETTTICNLRCKACPTGLGQLNRAATHVRRELFDHLLASNKDDFKYFDLIFPFIFGEPLLNKDLPGYIRALRAIAPPYARIELHTNGNVGYSKGMLQELLMTGVDLINISVDGTDQEAYEHFRIGGNFETVRSFVRALAEVKREMGLIRPEIVMQMIVTKYTEHQVDDADKMRRELGADRLLLKGYFYEFTGLSDDEGAAIAPSREEVNQHSGKKDEMIKRKKHLCGWAYRSISIMNNGNVTPCCIDYNTTLLDGLNVADTRIRRIWNSRKYRIFRRGMLRGRYEICNKCFFS